MTANLKGSFLASLAAIPHLIRPGGRIVNISSVTAFLGGHGGSIAYATSKAGLHGLTYALVRELSQDGITVNAVAPGFIEGDFNADFPPAARSMVLDETPLGRTGSVADVVAAVRYLASAEASFVTGEILHVNGGRVFGRSPASSSRGPLPRTRTDARRRSRSRPAAQAGPGRSSAGRRC